VDWQQFEPSTMRHRISLFAFEVYRPAAIVIHKEQPVVLPDPVVENQFEGQVVFHLPPVQVDGEEENQVSSIVDSWVD
jgi:hypothetical protein